MTDDDDQIVEFMARQPDLLHRLLDEHVDDGSGHCRVCAIGGQRGYLTWPCNIVLYANRAAGYEQAGRTSSDTRRDKYTGRSSRPGSKVRL